MQFKPFKTAVTAINLPRLAKLCIGIVTAHQDITNKASD
jgi:hypothetical protein